MFSSIGRFCVRRRRFVLAGALLFFVAGIIVGSGVFMHLKESDGSSGTESVQGSDLIDRASGHGPEMVAVVDGPRVGDPAVRQAVLAAAARVAAVRGVTGVVTAYDRPDPMLRAADGRASLMVISTAKTGDMMRTHQEVADVRRVLSGSVPGAAVKVGGELAVMRDSAVTSQSDLFRGELFALPVLLLALLLVFRGLRAALLPILGSLVSVAGALLLLRAVTGITDVSGYAVDVVALFGLALSVDYSLLMVNRFREERAAGHDAAGAVVRSVETAGRTITYSAVTVMASLAGLFAFGDPTFSSLAIGGIATTLIAVLTGLFVIPALLAAWGSKIRPEPPADSSQGVFGRLARSVQRRPVAVAAGCAVGLVALAVPFLSVNYGSGDPRLLPRSFESRAVADTLLARFPGMQAEPIMVVAQRPAGDPAVRAYAGTIRSLPGVAGVSVEDTRGTGLSVIDVMPAGATQSAAAQDLVRALRADRPGYRTFVTGSAAFLIDFRSQIATRLPWALLLIGLATFVLLFLMTGSVLVPATMTLLGDKNWWAPRPLRHLHDRYGLHEAPDPAGHRVAAARDEGMARPSARPAAGIRSGT
jgi:putative drug exporter of the RND superfamily